jgi:hypothetical protein
MIVPAATPERRPALEIGRRGKEEVMPEEAIMVRSRRA